MAITTGTADDHHYQLQFKDHGHQQQQRHRKLLTKAAPQIWSKRHNSGGGGGGTMVAARRGRERGGVGAVICISILLTIFAIKIVGTAGNAIRNSDDHQNMMRIIINDTDSGTTRGIRTNGSSSGDSSSIPSRPQNHHHHHLPPGQQQQLSHSSATDANRTLLAGGAAVVVAPSSSSSSLSSWAGRAASYSYFYIGRKLIYVPLFFLLYWTVYNIVLLGQSIASRWVSARMGCRLLCLSYSLVSDEFGDLSCSRKWEQ